MISLFDHGMWGRCVILGVRPGDQPPWTEQATHSEARKVGSGSLFRQCLAQKYRYAGTLGGEGETQVDSLVAYLSGGRLEDGWSRSPESDMIRLTRHIKAEGKIVRREPLARSQVTQA
jgi:hypothetical protein